MPQSLPENDGMHLISQFWHRHFSCSVCELVLSFALIIGLIRLSNALNIEIEDACYTDWQIGSPVLFAHDGCIHIHASLLHSTMLALLGYIHYSHVMALLILLTEPFPFVTSCLWPSTNSSFR
jgi:Zn-dependent protease